jgi:hypothetical protein
MKGGKHQGFVLREGPPSKLPLEKVEGKGLVGALSEGGHGDFAQGENVGEIVVAHYAQESYDLICHCWGREVEAHGHLESGRRGGVHWGYPEDIILETRREN